MEEQAQLKLWVEAWRKAGPKLQRIREEEVRRTETVKAILALCDDLQRGLSALPVRSTSGLVQQQAYFRKPRKER